MSVNPCDRALLCDCSPTPFRNFSSEAPDPADFFAMAFFAGSPPLNAPPGFWTIPGSAPGTCESVISTVDAQDCAVRGAETKVWDTWIEGGVPVRQFGNAEQTCQLPCNVGDPFIYTLPAGTVIATSQLEADELAASICLYRANLAKVCSAVPTIEAVAMDNAYDLAANAKVVTGDLGGFASVWRASVVTVQSLPGSVSGFFPAVSPNGHWVVGSDSIAGTDHASSYNFATLQDLNTGSDGVDVTDLGTVLCKGAGGGVAALRDAATGALIANILAAFAGTNITFASNAKLLNSSLRVCTRTSAINGRRLYYWQGGVKTEVTPADYDFGNNNNQALGVNEAGQVFGTYHDNIGNDRSWFNTGLGAVSVKLPSFGGFVTAAAMNGSGQVVGQADNGSGFYTAFSWTSAGGIILLPSFPDITPGASAAATDINDAGWIVGTMDNQGFVYHGGQIHKLLELLPLGTGWTAIDSALFINNLKQVVGQGTYLGIPGTLYIMQLV